MISHFSVDLESMSVKQLKEILMLNRVDFKGCCEKQELKERVERLWQDHKTAPRKLQTRQSSPPRIFNFFYHFSF